MTGASTTRSAAGRLAVLAAGVVGGELPIRLRAWDGSEAGPDGGPVLVVHRRRAIRRLLRSPGELGFTEAYIAGDVEIDGDLAGALSALWSMAETGAAVRAGVTRWLGAAAQLGIFGRGPSGPDQPLGPEQRRHAVDAAALTHPDDLPDGFYELLLGSSMASSCGYFADGPGGDQDAAQQAGLDLICRTLGLESGSRHLDIGCGWGALICHAAQHYGTHSTGVTASRRQYDYVTKRIADAGLTDRVQVRLAYPSQLAAGADDGQFDAVSAIETGEQIGAEYPTFAALLHRVLRPGGRAVVQQVSAGEHALHGGVFVRTYIAPKVQVRTLDATVSSLGAAGFEVGDVQALSGHYGPTLKAWAESLERSWNGVVDLVGQGSARLWKLYLVGGALAFAEDRLSVELIAAVRPPTASRSPSPGIGV